MTTLLEPSFNEELPTPDPLIPPAPEATVLPATQRADARSPVPTRRQLGGASRSDRRTVVGALVSAGCTSALLFGRVAGFSGRLGFVVVTYLVFLATYALLT